MLYYLILSALQRRMSMIVAGWCIAFRKFEIIFKLLATLSLSGIRNVDCDVEEQTRAGLKTFSL